MGIDTYISYCDSTLNLQMGCDGCELWQPAAGVRDCYAGLLTDRRGGTNKGYPERFDRPRLFLERLDAALLRWPDLTGTARPHKPWLDGRPRVVFLDDMGDTFTESLPLDWLAQPYGPLTCPNGHRPPRVQLLEREGKVCCTAAGCCIVWTARSPLELMGRSPHVYLLVTKRAKRLAEFSRQHRLPANFWPIVSITGPATLSRVEELANVAGGGVRGVSAAPLRAPVNLWPYLESGLGEPLVQWLIIEGEAAASREKAHRFDLAWGRLLVRQAAAAGVPCHVKQLGTDPWDGDEPLKLRDRRGGDPLEWPWDLRVRQCPQSFYPTFAESEVAP